MSLVLKRTFAKPSESLKRLQLKQQKALNTEDVVHSQEMKYGTHSPQLKMVTQISVSVLSIKKTVKHWFKISKKSISSSNHK